MNKLPPEQLLEKFENQTLEKSLWTHEAHLTIAFMYLKKYTPEETIILLRCGIISYNNAVGTINSLNRGYHETMTMFWIWVVASYIHQYPENKIAFVFISDMYLNLPARDPSSRL